MTFDFEHIPKWLFFKAYDFETAVKVKVKGYIVLDIIAYGRNVVALCAGENKDCQKKRCLVWSQRDF